MRWFLRVIVLEWWWFHVWFIWLIRWLVWWIWVGVIWRCLVKRGL